MDDNGLAERIRAVLDDEPVAFAYLFGSAARGDTRPTAMSTSPSNSSRR
ncbi:MAG: hypothetical protein KG028_06875 [Actinobacteria bacterium]|nr:hypothetical protein [Actinomycetota bacterium]